jgi:hypothetical protein
MNRIPDELLHILTKTILPALVAVSVGIAVKMQKMKVTIISAITSYVIGLGFAFIFGFAIHEHIETGWATVIIGAIAITGEKIGHWLIFKLDVDEVMEAFVKRVERLLKGK